MQLPRSVSSVATLDALDLLEAEWIHTKARVQVNFKWPQGGKQGTLVDLMHFDLQVLVDNCETENILLRINEVVQSPP